MEPANLLYLAEDENQTVQVNDAQISYLEAIKTPEWLENAEHPFKWMKSLQYRNIVKSIHRRLARKLPDYKNQGPDYGFEKFSVFLTRLCMDQMRKRLDENPSGKDKLVDDDCYSDSSVEDVEVDQDITYRMLESVVEEMRGREGDVMYTRIGPAFEHVLTATRANMLHLMGRDEESKQIAKMLVPMETSENRAGIEAIKAKFILFMYHDLPVPLNVSKLAMELDPKFAYWKYLTGKIIRRQRRFLTQNIEQEELECFKHAVELERNPKFLVYLAQANQEMAKISEKQEMLEESVHLFRECWRLKSDSAPIVRRVGNGMMKMKGEHSDIQLAENALLKAIELSPNHITYHALGKFYLEYGNDEEKALECFNKFKGSFAKGELIRYHLIKDPKSDVSHLIKACIDSADGIKLQDILYCNIGWYYLAIQRDIFQATHFFWKVLSKDSKDSLFRMLEFESYAFGVCGPVDMLKVLVSEVKITIEENCQKPNGTRDNEALNTFLEKIYEKDPDLKELAPNRYLLREIKAKAEFHFKDLRNQRFGKANCGTTVRYGGGNYNQTGRSRSWNNSRDLHRHHDSYNRRRHDNGYQGNNNRGSHEQVRERNQRYFSNRYDTTDKTNWRHENGKK